VYSFVGSHPVEHTSASDRRERADCEKYLDNACDLVSMVGEPKTHTESPTVLDSVR
jgi:hypothetical protein